LDLADELVCQVDVRYLFIALLKVLNLLCILIAFLDEIILQFLSTLLENIDDLNLIEESFLRLLGLDISLVNFAELFPEDLTHYGNWMIVLAIENLFPN
jgi:hypothetical protein